ncbi:ABC transporter permease [Cryobacterium tagatosivorans]|uniref:ABC transporter permease n=1 Tax=Cryobacterium tagatosivorans TaxID=1259199 RepID=A0A4V6QG16_9MICO|nr:ABC transporter permease [Cryobacterium tagatosivorans]TFB47822.1 ABC transporter permease [Cryobacterium tagatosivorans]
MTIDTASRWRVRWPGWEVAGLPAVLVALFVLFSVLAPNFAEVTNFTNVARQVAVLALIATAQTVVILTAGIDLSVGSVVALASVLTAIGLREGNPTLGIAMALGAGLLVGAVNGAIIGFTSVAPFIVTLGMLSIVSGTALTITNGDPIFELPDSWFFNLGIGFVGPVPIPVIIAAVVFALIWILLYRTRMGIHVYAVGGNEQAANLAGIAVARTKLQVYMLSGLCAALGGVILTARVHSGQPLLGQGMELNAVAAVVIGGTSLFGGRGRLIGTIYGVLLVGIVSNGLDLLGISTFIQRIVIGAATIGAVLLTVMREGGRKR